MPIIETPTDVEKLYASLPDLIPQKINMNGTSKSSLLDDYRNILRILRELDAALAGASPHGRDYQTHSDPQTGTKARIAWSCRRILISEMLKDVEHSAIMLYEQH